MGELMLRPDERDLLRAINRPDGAGPLPVPFEREIYLASLVVVGTYYVQNIGSIFQTIEVDDPIRLVREPDNPYDEYAVRVETANAEKLGYCPSPGLTFSGDDKLGYISRANNKLIARLMDAGKLIYGRVRLKELINGSYYKILIRVFMKD